MAHLESEPTCERNLRERSKLSTNEIISMRCNVSYRGHWLPTVEWKQHNSNGGWEDSVGGTPVANGLVETVIGNISLSSSLTVFANSTTDGSYYSFNVFFTSQNGSIRANATNIPESKLTWKSSLISTKSTTSKSIVDTTSTEQESLTLQTTKDKLINGYITLHFIHFRHFDSHFN